MYKKLSQKITNHFINKQIISKDDREIYEYSYEVLLAESVYIFIMIVIGLLFHAFIASLFFFIGFYLCRKVSGGYHASTYTKCHILFAMNHILFIGLSKFIPQNLYWIITLVFVGISIVLIYFLAPIDHPNKPFDEHEHKKYKRQSRVFILITLLATVVLYMVERNNPYYFYVSIGIFSASMSLLYSFFERRKKHEKNQKLYG